MDLPRFERGESLGSCHSSVPARMMVRPSRTAAGAAPKAPPTQLHTIELLLGGRQLRITFRQPFDLLAETAAIEARNQAGSTANPAQSEIWLGDPIRTNLPPDFNSAYTKSRACVPTLPTSSGKEPCST